LARDLKLSLTSADKHNLFIITLNFKTMKNEHNRHFSLPEGVFTYTRAEIRSYLLLILLSLGCMFALYGQSGSDSGQPILPANPALPGGMQVKEAWRMQKDVFYVTPEGKSPGDYNDLDKVSMRPYETDLRYFHTTNSEGSPLFIEKVLNPENYFVPQVIPHDLMIIGPEYTFFYDEKGNLLATEATLPDLFEEEAEDEPLQEGISPGEMNLPAGWERTPHGFSYKDAQQDLYIEPATGLVSMETRDLDGLWYYRSMEINDPNDRDRGVPVYKIGIFRRELPSGDCVFLVETERYSEYFRAAEPQDPQAGLRSAGNDPGAMELEGVRLWPNPVSDALNVYLPAQANQDQASLEVISLSGSTVLNQILVTGSAQPVSVQHLPAGVYLVKITAGTKVHFDKIIIP
jgi:hypothetical protein